VGAFFMTNLFLIVICLIIGLLLQKAKAFPKEAHLTLNHIILFVPLPSIALLTIPTLEWKYDLLVLTFAPWFLFCLSFIFFRYLGLKFGWSHSLIGCLTLTAGLGNTAFVGFPVIEALYGKEALPLAVFLDQPGSFLIVSSLGLFVATFYSSGKVSKRELARKVIFFPPFMAFSLAVILSIFNWRAEGEIKLILERLSLILTPLALISVGLQLKLSELKLDLKFLSLGLFFKLVLSPLVIYAIYSLFDLPELIFKVGVVESAMAPMITGSIVASTYGLHPRLSGSMLGLGVPLSFLTLLFWSYVVS
jgi:malate permease and related proteins